MNLASKKILQAPTERVHFEAPNLRVLLCSDEPQLSHEISTELTRFDIVHRLERVHAPESLSTALAEVRDLLILDLDAPQFDARDVIRRVRHFSPDLPVIFLDRTYCQDAQSNAYKVGAVEYLARDRIEFLREAVGRCRNSWVEQRDKQYALWALMHSEQRFRNLLEAAPNGFVIFNQEGLIILVNAHTEKLFGYARRELIGRPISVLIPDFDMEMVQTRPSAEPHQVHVSEAPARHQSGRNIPVELFLAPMETDEDALHILIVQDRSLRKETEDALRQRERQYRTLFNAIPDPVFIFDVETLQFLEFNDAVLHVYGYSADELFAMTALDLHPDEENAQLRQRILSGSNNQSEKWTHVTRDGHRFAVEIMSSGLDYGGRRASLSIVRDTSAHERVREELEQYAADLEFSRTQYEDRANEYALMFHELDAAKKKAEEAQKKAEEALKRAEEASSQAQIANEKLKQSQAKLVHSEKMASLGQLAAGIAHEINNPIGFITSNLNTLAQYVETFSQLLTHYEHLTAPEAVENDALRQAELDKINSIKAEEDLDFIAQDLSLLIGESSAGLLRVKEIVQGLKNFARIDSDERQEADINKGIEATLRVIWNELKYRCNVVTDLGPLPHIYCHSGQLNQVFMNLIMNAAQAIDSEGTITIQTEYRDEHVLVRISDTGCGISPENLDKIYNPFFTTKPVGEGTGLGLSISFGIIEKHGGRIEVESDPGQGTTFTVFLPAIRGDDDN